MEYYLYLPGDNKTDLNNDHYMLGTESFNNFWPEDGLNILYKIVLDGDELLIESITIVNSSGRKFTIREFLDKIKYLKVKEQYI